MAKTHPSPFPLPPKRMYWGADIPMRVIHRYARAIAEEFHPDKIILFGSYAWGRPQRDSDAPVLMPAYNQHNQAVRIRWRLAAPFPVDLIVRTPKEMKWRLAEGESFTTAIVSQGKVLHEKGHARVGEEGRAGLHTRRARKPKNSVVVRSRGGLLDIDHVVTVVMQTLHKQSIATFVGEEIHKVSPEATTISSFAKWSAANAAAARMSWTESCGW
jgi:predicted nucleotidyltransferase